MKTVEIKYKDGKPFRKFASMLDLGIWLFAKYEGMPETDRQLLAKLSFTPTMAKRAINAYVAWLVGTGRTCPAKRKSIA